MTADLFPHDEDPDFDSTLIRHGVRALTFSDMQDFAEMVEQRPLDKLLGDFHEFAGLSDSKFAIARKVIRRRLRELPEVEQSQLRLLCEECIGTDEAAAERVRHLFD